MKEIVKRNCAALDHGMNECCNIAESMIEEIHQIVILKSDAIPTSNGKHKGSLKKRLLRQIRQARKMTMIG
ncbi:MAG: hypothetical protein HGA93_00600 [Methanothrix sp.]|nr:hypothetical protein [Methanothrix sp.]